MQTMERLSERLGQRRWLKDGIALPDVVADLWRRWNEPHRRWHDKGHLFQLLEESGSAEESLRFPLGLTIAFHDAIYDPRRQDNEILSAELFLSYANLDDPAIQKAIVEAIEDTARGTARNPLSEALLALDRGILRSTSLEKLLAWEQGIAWEYQRFSWPEYVDGRTRFLRESDLVELARYVETRRPRVGIYAGRFDPFHRGHLDILLRAEKLFDKVIVAVGINPAKNADSIEKRLNPVRRLLPFHEVRGFSGLLTDLVGEVGAYADASVVRGLRDGYDLQQEINQARFLEDLLPELRTVWIPCDRRSQHISSTAIRALQKFGAEEASAYLPNLFAYAGDLP